MSAISVMHVLPRVVPWRCTFCRSTQKMWLNFTALIVTRLLLARAILVKF